ncbi:MAG: multiheme c-type cytochrome [Planctomycetaceae bacterium]
MNAATIWLQLIAAVWMTGCGSVSFGADWIGSSSCGSSTCHGNTVGRGPAWSSSYTVSRSRDPHATAGSLLYDWDSRAIVAALSPDLASLPDDQRSTAYDVVLRKRCISCHLTATAADVASTAPLERQQVGEGVSCETCHGPASQWRDLHLLASWQGDARFDSTTGMLDTESLVARAEGCVRCHVGSRTADGLVRDMNHDLIAAGHPALRFDLLTYNDNMPHHWDDDSEVEKTFGASAMKVRNVGRSIGLVAAARLSSERAAAAQEAASADAADVPWPELSDFDCFACHQSLSPRAYRLPSNVDGKPKLEVSNGLPLWNAWYSAAAVGAADNQLRSFRPQSGRHSDWIAAADKVAELYRTKALVDAVAQVEPALSSIGTIRRELNKLAPSDWNAAAVMYLSMEAAARDLASEPATQSLGKALMLSLQENVSPLLLFDSGKHESDGRLRSPQDFDPRVFRAITLKALDSVEEVQP